MVMHLYSGIATNTTDSLPVLGGNTLSHVLFSGLHFYLSLSPFLRLWSHNTVYVATANHAFLYHLLLSLSVLPESLNSTKLFTCQKMSTLQTYVDSTQSFD